MKNTVLTPALTGISTFRFKDTCSRDLGIIITKPPEESIPERDIETISVPGRMGIWSLTKAGITMYHGAMTVRYCRS